MKIRIGTRGSDLALWQARFVESVLARSGAEIELIVLETRGDRIQDKPLTQVDGRSFFTAEIENALLEHRVDLAVHSHKDLATEMPSGLEIVAIPSRGPVEERLLIAPASHDENGAFLPIARGASVGTGSPRRREQLRTLRPDLSVEEIRGNVPTRVQKLRDGRYDAIVLAAAGLERLGLDHSDLVEVTLARDLLVPAPAQGALAIEARSQDLELRELCRALLHDEETAAAVAAERRLLAAAGGGCNLPLGATVARSRDGNSYVAYAFLGRDHPREGLPARYARAEASDPTAAGDAIARELDGGRPTGAGPLSGLRVALCGSGGGNSVLEERLAALGAMTVREAVIEYEDLAAPELAGTLSTLTAGDAIALTSRHAARRVAEYEIPESACIAAVGPSTAATALELLGRVDFVGPGGGRALAQELDIAPGARVVFPCAEEARTELCDVLAGRGVQVSRFALYRTRPCETIHLDPSIDFRVYLSPSAVRSTLASESATDGPAHRVALGSTVSAALREAGLPCLEPEGDGPDAAIAVIARHSLQRTRAN